MYRLICEIWRNDFCALRWRYQHHTRGMSVSGKITTLRRLVRIGLCDDGYCCREEEGHGKIRYASYRLNAWFRTRKNWRYWFWRKGFPWTTVRDNRRYWERLRERDEMLMKCGNGLAEGPMWYRTLPLEAVHGLIHDDFARYKAAMDAHDLKR